jgi:hypothetical protein
MHSSEPQFRRSKIALSSLLILLCITAAPDRQWAKAPAAAECPTLKLNTAPLPNGSVGSPYGQTFSASGGQGPYTFSINSGALPPGLTLQPRTGRIIGTPTTAGNYIFTVRATDANGCVGERAYTVVIAAVVNAVTSVSAASFDPNSVLAIESIAAAFRLNVATSTETCLSSRRQ